jgi:hypothetical protein
MMATRCLIVRGLVKEVEEEVNKFLATHEVRVQQIAQSENSDHICLTLLFEYSESASRPAIDPGAPRKQSRPDERSS